METLVTNENWEWVQCPKCKKKLAKRLENGQYESKIGKAKCYLVVGSIVCPNCSELTHVPLTTIKKRSVKNANKE
jgi:hypothetical protein